MTDTASPQPQPQQPIALTTRVPIMPTPTAIDFDIVQTPAGGAVGMRIQDTTGVKIVVLSAQQAKDAGEQLRNAGTRAALGLVIPTAKLP